MPRKVAQTSLKPYTEINLTPLIDLSFLLLVTFIITFPAITAEQGIPVNLPKGKARELPNTKRLTITVDKAGSIFLDGGKVSLELLGTRMQEVARVDPSVAILVRADDGIRYGAVVQVLKVLHEVKLTRVALVTQGEGTPGP